MPVTVTDPLTGKTVTHQDVQPVNQLTLASSPDASPLTATVNPQALGAVPAPPPQITLRQLPQQLLEGFGKQAYTAVSPFVEAAKALPDVLRNLANPETAPATRQGFREGAQAAVQAVPQIATELASDPIALLSGASPADVKEPTGTRAGRAMAAIATLPLAEMRPEFAPLEGFYSRFETEALPRLSVKGQHPQKIQNLVEKFVPKEEWAWMGGPEFLKAQGSTPITRDEVAAWFKAHEPVFKQTIHGPDHVALEQATAAEASARERFLAARSAADQRLRDEIHRLSMDETEHHATRIEQLQEARTAIVEAGDTGRFGYSPRTEEAFAAARAEFDELQQLKEARAELTAAKEARADLVRDRPSARYESYTLKDPKGEHYNEHLLSVPVRAPKIEGGPVTLGQKEVAVRRLNGIDGPVTITPISRPQGDDIRVPSEAFHLDWSQHPAVQHDPTRSWNSVRVDSHYGDESWHDTPEAAHQAAVEELDRRAHAAREDEMTFRHGHFDVPHYFLHWRTTLREIPGIGKILFGEEFQSDAHQAGRYNGYRQYGDKARLEAAQQKAAEERLTAWRFLQEEEQDKGGGLATPLIAKADALARLDLTTPAAELAKGLRGTTVGDQYQAPLERFIAAVREDVQADQALAAVGSAPPEMPFKKSWQELGLRMLLRDAVKQGREAIGWTTGMQQIERYRSAMQEVGSLRLSVKPIASGSSMQLVIKGRQGQVIKTVGLSSSAEIADWVGSTEAKKLLAQPINSGSDIRGVKTDEIVKERTLSPEETLTIGGKGMVEEYDKQMVALANKLGKPYGTQAELLPLGEKKLLRKGEPFWREAFTPEPFPGDHEPTPYEREEYEREPYDEPEPDDIDDQMESFDPWESGAPSHWVEVDDLEDNASIRADVLDGIRDEHPDLFNGTEGQAPLFEDTVPRAHIPLAGVTFEARPRVPGRDDAFEIVAHRRGERPRVIATQADYEFDSLEDAEDIAQLLQSGADPEPTQWRYKFDDGSGEEESDWFDSEREATREAESKRDELDNAWSDEMYQNERDRLRQEQRDWEAGRDEHERREDRAEARHNAEQDALQAEHDRHEAALAEQANQHAATPEARAAWQDQQAQRQREHEIAEDARMEEHHAQGLDKDQVGYSEKSKVWVLKIPKAWAEELKAKGQPLPNIVLPLTGAGLAAYAASQRQQTRKPAPQ